MATGASIEEATEFIQMTFTRPEMLWVALRHNKKDKRDTRMQMGLHLFEPIRIYPSSPQWPVGTNKGVATQPAADVSWLELLLGFWCTTRSK